MSPSFKRKKGMKADEAKEHNPDFQLSARSFISYIVIN